VRRIAMRSTFLKNTLKTAVFAVTILLLGVGVSVAQISLTAGPATLTLPNGSTVPMWGYTCGLATTGQIGTCAPLNPNAPTGTWSPVLITVPTGSDLNISLTNLLTFTPTTPTGSTANTVPTSLVIIGQVGGGLGGGGTTTPSPSHAQLGVSWATVNTPGGTNPTFTPPPQGPRVQSFSTEVTVTGGATTLTWKAPRPGTYLIESGTHPSIQVPMGLYGIVVVTGAPGSGVAGTTSSTGCAYPGATTGSCAVSYNAELPLEFSEIDPVQNAAVNAAVNTAGFSETKVWSGQPGGCGNAASGTNYQTCYPPAVNYTPLYYLINGVAFDKTNATRSLFAATASLGQTGTPVTTGISGTILVRLVNAGSHMHVPSIVGSLTTPGATTAVPTPSPVTGFSIFAEDGNVAPGLPKIQSDVFMAAGKTYDVMINVPASGGTGVPIYDRELSLSGNATARDAGMLAYIGVNGAGLPADPAFTAAVANDDPYSSLVPGQTLTVSDPSKGVIANDVNVYGVQLLTAPTLGTVTLAANGTFVYVPNSGTTSDSFTYCANGSVTGTTCSSGITAKVTLGAATVEAASGITCLAPSFTSTMATYIAIKTPGVLAGCTDAKGYPLTLNTSTVSASGGLSVLPDANGGFTATAPGAGTYTFTFQAKNGQGTVGPTTPVTATVIFPAASGLSVTVLDGYDKTTPITDYRWIIEEDRTFYIDPACTQNPPAATCPTASISGQGVSGIVPTLGVNFHTSYMPFVAQGCTGPKSCEAGQTVYDPTSGSHLAAVCDVSNGLCRTTGTQNTVVLPSQVALDPSKRYYISVLPGDAADPFINGYGGSPDCTTTGHCGHGMGGAPLAAACKVVAPATTCTGTFAGVTVLTQPSPYPPGKLSVFVFEDDFPLNGEQDGGGGIDVLSPNEPGLGNFQIHLWDAMGGNGDFTGQMTYDMFNQPLSNSLAGTLDPVTGIDACPISVNPRQGTNDPTQTGITGMIVTCPKYESDGVTLSPLAGQAVVANLMPGRWGVVATPGADRIARGEEWLQTNTLDGQKAHDVFTRIGEPAYFQEFGPAGYHVSVGFANPAIINSRKQYVCAGSDPNISGPNCTNTLKGKVTGERLSRTPDERLYSSGSHDTYYWTQCYVSFGDPDGEDFAFTKCADDGTFTLSGLPNGNWRVTVFDQWNDLLVDGLSTPVALTGGTTDLGDIASTQWQTNLYTRTFIDDNKDGVSQASEGGISFANVAVRLRDGSLENLLVTDPTGTANFNETFPLFSWYTVETDVTRYKNTGTHVVYDVGGPADGSAACGVKGYPPCGSSTIGKFLANTAEKVSVPTNLRVPGAVYCANADCTGKSIQNGPATSDPPSACTTDSTGNTTCSTILSSGRIDPPFDGVEGWQGFPGQNNFLEFGKEPYAIGENGGIKGHVIYASTRPFDDPQMLVQTQWEPLVPHVTINLYQEGFASDGVTPTLTLVDTTKTSSWDDYAQGFHQDASGNLIPNMNCPGQGASSGPLPDLFFYSLYNQPNYLDWYNSQHTGGTFTALPNNGQFKCYDGMHNWNQLQPAPYDGMYQFPSVTSTDPTTGKPNGTNCSICTANTAVPMTDLYYGLPMLPTGKYVVEVVVPPGFELVKEEDKNILIGDNFIAPVTQEFGGLGNVFIIPDQASVAAAQQYPGPGYNANNAQNPTQSLGANPENQIVPGFIPEPVWPCVGEARVVPDYISLYPASHQVAPFAGATRHLCDRKEVTLNDQMGAIAKFYVYTSAHIASKFTGGITDDYTSEFDPFSPTFGEKFSPPDLPVSVKDWAGNETNRVYADHWGSYDGMTYSTWEVNPPNPTGYSPTMMVVCMNDPGPISQGGAMVTDPLFAQGYSQFCYELPFMPGTTQYLDTPVVPTSAFAGAGYNNVDCAYPDTTPAIAEVDGDGIGPWVSASGHQLTIKSLGVQSVPNNAYTGPQATIPPYNQKTITRNYGFGSTAGTVVLVGSDGVKHALTGVSWGNSTITGNVPSGVPNCNIQQQAQYGGSTAQCGELIITAANGKQSIDTVTVTIGGKAPTHVAATGTIQSAIDAAAPGDLIIVDPTCNATAGGAIVPCSSSALNASTPSQSASQAAHNELVLMWKPVRLQGVGAASSVINANTHPAGKLDTWRQEVNCLFGLSLTGTPTSSTNPFDPTGASSCPATGWNYFVGSSTNPQVDRLPLEATVGWDASLNGNLAELLQEPTLMGALEGAAITVLSKGVNFPAGSQPFAADTFPTGTTLLMANNCGPNTKTAKNPYPSNFWCNPSSIDGLGLTDSSQGGGAVFVHAWGHNIQIANNRVYNNAGTLSGGLNIGQGEFPPAYISGSTTNAAPGSCMNEPANVQQPYCHNMNVNVHNNYISLNSSTGDELFSATPAGAGGVSFCTGADYYKFNNNWVCGNMSSGDGGGLGHLGFSYNGDIEHNAFLFNQSINPTIPANGGAMVIAGAPDVDPTCGAQTDQDCVPSPAGSVGPSDGVGPNLVINANLIMGNAAESGTGGGVAFQNVNGSEVVSFPNNPSRWHHVTFTNNIVADNVAGWDGAGVSVLDALNLDVVNNTIINNASTGSAGVLFNTIGAPLASQPSNGGTGPGQANCTNASATSSCPQVAGLVSLQNSAVLTANIASSTVVCPAGHFQTTASNGTCKTYSYPLLANNVLWHNSSYYIGVGALSPQYQQNVVSLYNAFTTTLAPSQSTTGQCVAASFWDLGVRGDTSPTPNSGNAGHVVLNPTWSVLTSTTGYAGSNIASDPSVVSQYCDGSRTPPEYSAAGSGWLVPPGISDATVPNPIFNLTPVATVDEGNNWVNMRWGPLSLSNPSGTILANYALTSGSPAIDHVPVSQTHPTTDYFGNARPDTANPSAFDIGAIEFQGSGGGGGGAAAMVSPSTLAFGNWATGTTSNPMLLTVTNTGTTGLTGGTFTFGGGTPQPFSRVTTGTFPAGAPNCGATLAIGASCTIKVRFAPGAVTSYSRTLTVAYTGVTVTGSPVTLTGAGVATRAAVTISPNPLTITLPTAGVGANTGIVTLTNTTAAGGSSVAVSSVATSGGNIFTYLFLEGALVGGTDNCTGTNLAPGASCTVTVGFLDTLGLVSAGNYPGTVTFTDTAAGTPAGGGNNRQTGNLIGVVP
jgi:Bacterial Ig domain